MKQNLKICLLLISFLSISFSTISGANSKPEKMSDREFALAIFAVQDSLQEVYSIDPSQFELSALERFLEKDQNPVHQSVTHLLLSEAKQWMQRANVNNRDMELRDSLSAEIARHRSQVLNDMESLMQAKASDFDSLLTRPSDAARSAKDEAYFHGDLLHVLVYHLGDNSTYAKAAELYEKSGNKQASMIMQIPLMRSRYEQVRYSRQNLYLSSLQSNDKAAIDYLDSLLQAYGDFEPISQTVKSWMSDISQPYAQSSEVVLLPNVETKVPFAIKNMDKLSVTIRQFVGRDSRNQLLQTGKILYQKTLTPKYLHKDRRVEADTVEMSIKLPAGEYVWIIENRAEFRHVSSLGLIMPNKTKQDKPIAVDIITGRPNKKATIEYDSKSQRYRARLSKSDYTEWCYSYSSNSTWSKTSTHCSIYTNRNLYRPSQQMHAVAICWTQNNETDMAQTMAGKQVTVVIYNPNGEKVYNKKLTTNAYGSIDIDYSIPSDAKLGHYSIQVNSNGYRSFEVSEYKRPSFEVLAKGICSSGKVTFSGSAMALSGAPMQNASVHYTLTCQPSYYRYYRNGAQSVHLEGDCVTDKAGQFEVVKSIDSLLKDNSVNPDYYHIVLQATVTSLSGETQQTSAYAYLQYKQYILSSDVPGLLNLEKSREIVINARDAEQKQVSVKGNFYLMRQSKPIFHAIIHSGSPVALPQDLASGSYSLRVTTAADTLEENIQILNPSQQKSCFDADFSYSPSYELTEQGIDIYVAPREKDCYMYVFVVDSKSIVDSMHWVVSSGLRKLHLPYKKAYGKSIGIRMGYIRNGHSWTSDMMMYEAPQPKMQMGVKLTTFRDKTTPGAQENWTLQVVDKNGKPAKAEVQASLYDAALEQIAGKNRWNMNVRFTRPYAYFYNYMQSGAPDQMFYYYANSTYQPEYDFALWSWNGFNLSPYGLYYGGVKIRGVGSVKAANMSMKQNVVMDMVAEAEYAIAEEAAVPSPQAARMVSGNAIEADATDDMDEDIADISAFLRKDFSEDALWMPHCFSNDNGEAQICFTMPDALTEWRLNILAHTADMQHGQLDTTIRVSKTLMLQPMWPRFVRQNDSIVLGATAMNRTAQMLDATATLEIRTADSATVLVRMNQHVTIAPDSSVLIAFPIKENRWGDSVIATMAIAGKNGGDGEQIYIPVLAPELKDTAKVVSTRLAPEEEIKKAVADVKAPKLINAMDCALAIYINHEKGKSTVAAETKLRALQKADGSFAWYPGMEGSYYMTLSVAEMLERSKGVMTKELKKALNWLDEKELESYRRQVAKKQPFAITESTIHYLLLSARVGNNPSEAVKAMQQDYLKEIEKSALTLTNKREARRSAFSIYGVANLADMFILQDKIKPADACLYHLKHYSVYREGFGRYYATDQAQYSWMDYKLPTQLAAIQALLEAKAANYKDRDLTQYSAEMLLWVLRQTQTQQWQNPLNILLANELVKNTKTTDVGAEWQYLLDNTENPVDGALLIERYFTADTLKIGNRVTLRTRITADRDMDFLKVVIPLPASVEPTEQLSGYRWLGGAYGYVEQHDDRVEISINHFRTGSCTLDLDFFVVRDGLFTMPQAQVVCTYNPIFRANTAASRSMVF